VKTLQDPDGRRLNLGIAQRTTVESLRSLPLRRGDGDTRGPGVESRVYEVHVRLLVSKVEEDGDIHLVIAGLKAPGATMIVELPSPACTKGATSAARTRMASALKAFVAACGSPGSSSFSQLSGRATIRGVGFFDFLHRQTGVAPNGIELHPVLAFHATTACGGGSNADNAPTVPPAPVKPPPPKPVPGRTSKCDPSYPTVCIAPYPPDLNCADVPYKRFKVIYNVARPDPHGFDGDRDGIGCES